jgi:four helix bundle protein
MIRSGTVAVSERFRRFRGFRKFRGFRGFLFNGFSEFSRFSGFWVPFWLCDNEQPIGTCRAQCGVVPGGWRSHEEISIQRDARFRDHIQGAVSSAPRLIAEGFGRYLPGDFSGYLRKANGELKETLECLSDGVDRGYFTSEQIVPLQRLCKRASKAATGLIAYLKTANAPNEEPRRRRTSGPRGPRNLREPRNPREPPEQKPFEPPEPLEPMEPMD